MSKYTGKCDLYDWFGEIACNEGETPFECYKRLNSRIFMDNTTEVISVKIEKPSDLVMFYPFIHYLHFYSEDGKDMHYIPSGSYLSHIAAYNPEAVAKKLQDLLDEYWRVKEEEDIKYAETHEASG